MTAIDPDSTKAARKIACVLLGLLEPETAQLLASKAAERGEPWLYEHWRKWLSDDPELSLDQRRRLMRIPTHDIDGNRIAQWERELLAQQEETP